MSNPEHLAILKQGVEVWNLWREENASLRPDLSDADLTEFDLDVAIYAHPKADPTDYPPDENGIRYSADPYGVDLKGAVLRNAKLRGLNLTLSEFDGADLSGAELGGANIRMASFRGAILRKANLHDTFFSDCDFTATDFTDAWMYDATFKDIDVSVANGLQGVDHHGPSTIAIDSLVKSKGNIPIEFLRGAGIPEPFILHLKALIGAMEPIQFCSCFISYSTHDQEFANRLYANLQSQGVRCWFAPHDVKGGQKLHEQIDEAIRVYDRLLLILSEASMSSEWVKTEIANTRQREIREKRQMLFPISVVPLEKIKEWNAFDADTGNDSAREIPEYFIPDFSNWKDRDSYQAAFQRLLRDLKAGM